MWLGVGLLSPVHSCVGAGRAGTADPADDPRFTGKTDVMESKDLSMSRRRFDLPVAPSAWHSHDKGQLLFVEEGRARTQKRGQPVKELGVGDSDYTGPNVVHWHGAVPPTPSSRSPSALAANRVDGEGDRHEIPTK